MSILDISNWTIDEINNSIDAFKDTSLTDIGMVNCDIESINIVGGITTATLWIDEDIGIDGYTGTAPLKIYKEDKIEIKLNSPLLKGDTIEVVDGKLCHVHRWGKVTFDNVQLTSVSESSAPNQINTKWYQTLEFSPLLPYDNNTCIINIFRGYTGGQIWNNDIEGFSINPSSSGNGQTRIQFRLRRDRFTEITVETINQWISENPIIIIYQLATPTYENITPLQSEIVLKTFEECNMNIITNLPIKTNVSYRTNVPSISTLSNRVAEVSESDNVIHNLINIIDDEVDE